MERLTKVMNCNDENKLYDFSNKVVSEYKEHSERVKLAVKKLAEYEDAEEQGLLVKLPCKVGDTLYLPYSRPRYIKEVMVTDFMFNGCDLHILTDFVTLGNRDIGKTVFLTKEEAEQALKDMESEG